MSPLVSSKIKKTRKKRVITSKTIYGRLKRNLKKDEEYSEVYSKIKQIKSDMKNKYNKMLTLEREIIDINNKNAVSDENIIEALPIESLSDLYGKNNNRLTFKDVSRAIEIRKELENIAETSETDAQELTIANIELLQKKIEFLIKSMETNED